jgi:hypothetical protein
LARCVAASDSYQPVKKNRNRKAKSPPFNKEKPQSQGKVASIQFSNQRMTLASDFCLKHTGYFSLYASEIGKCTVLFFCGQSSYHS